MTAEGARVSEREQIAHVLTSHVRDGRKSYVQSVCVCGWRGTGEAYRLHVADALISAGIGVMAEAWDDGYVTGFNDPMHTEFKNPHRAKE